VVLEEQAQRAADIQLWIADRITAFAGSMNFVYLHVALSLSGCCSSRRARGPNTELTRQIHRLTTELHRRLIDHRNQREK
jgi:hypothetical protein